MPKTHNTRGFHNQYKVQLQICIIVFGMPLLLKNASITKEKKLAKKKMYDAEGGNESASYVYVYIYIYICVCVCVFIWMKDKCLGTTHSITSVVCSMNLHTFLTVFKYLCISQWSLFNFLSCFIVSFLMSFFYFSLFNLWQKNCLVTN